jgi:hypothetical protein
MGFIGICSVLNTLFTLTQIIDHPVQPHRCATYGIVTWFAKDGMVESEKTAFDRQRRVPTRFRSNEYSGIDQCVTYRTTTWIALATDMQITTDKTVVVGDLYSVLPKL